MESLSIKLRFLRIAADFFTTEETESQRVEVACPRMSLEKGVKFKPMSIISEVSFSFLYNMLLSKCLGEYFS